MDCIEFIIVLIYLLDEMYKLIFLEKGKNLII